MSEQAIPSEPLGGFEREARWTIGSDFLMDMLYAVQRGESPEAVYVRAYNMVARHQPEG